MKKNFKTDLETIYVEVNRLAKEYKAEGISERQKNYIVTDILEITEELVRNLCRKFLLERTITEITTDELYAVAIGYPLIEVLEWFDYERGNNLVPMWKKFIINRFNNELGFLSTKKASFFRTNLSSFDKEFCEGETLHGVLGAEDFSEEVCSEIALAGLLDTFEKLDKHGKIIRCLLIGNQELRTKAILEVFGCESYGSTERKAVQRVKERFGKFLIHNQHELDGIDLKNFI